MSQATQPCRHSTGDHSQHCSAPHAAEHGCERFGNVAELRCGHVPPMWPPLSVNWQGPGKSQTQLTTQDRRKAEPRTRGARLWECWAHWPKPGPQKHRCRVDRGWPRPLSNHGEQGWTQDPAWMGHSRAPCRLPPFWLASSNQVAPAKVWKPLRRTGCSLRETPTSPKALRSGRTRGRFLSTSDCEAPSTEMLSVYVWGGGRDGLESCLGPAQLPMERAEVRHQPPP